MQQYRTVVNRKGVIGQIGEFLHVVWRGAVKQVNSIIAESVPNYWTAMNVNGKESSLIPTLRLENLVDILTECFSLLNGML